jgi:succinyl-CoA synthetase alpha subunit
MSILINSSTRVIVQGITGREGSFHTKLMKEYGTQIVGGVTPGKGGAKVEGVPVFDTMKEAVRETCGDTSIIFVPARFAAEAILEALDAGIRVIVCTPEGIPFHDMIQVCNSKNSDVTIVGPNTPGVISPGECKVGFMPSFAYTKGQVGVISKSGSLSYEISYRLTKAGIGQSTVVGVGGDPVKGSTFAEVLPLFDKDPQTAAVLLLGEVGGEDEEEAAKYIGEQGKKPVVAFLVGKSAPPGKKMGHASAIISGGKGSFQSKVEAFEDVGVRVIDDPALIPNLLGSIL